MAGHASDDPASAKPRTDSALMMVRRSVRLTGLEPATLDPQIGARGPEATALAAPNTFHCNSGCRNVSGVGHTEAYPPRSNGAWRLGGTDCLPRSLPDSHAAVREVGPASNNSICLPPHD